MTTATSDWHKGLYEKRGVHKPAVLADGTVVLNGEREWRYVGSEASAAALLAALQPLAEQVGPGALILRFGNAVGYFSIPGLGRIEVVTGKWGSSHYHEMLADLSRVATNLPYSTATSAVMPFDRSSTVPTDVLYHAFVYLRQSILNPVSHAVDLLRALNTITRDPHRATVREHRRVPLHQAATAMSRSLDGILASGLIGVTPEIASRFRLAKALQGHLPQAIEEVHAATTFNTAENRLVRAFLDQCSAVIDNMWRVLDESTPFGRRTLDECVQMRKRLAPVRRHSMWEEVGRMVHVPASSTVLHRRHGYKELYQHWAKLRLTAALPVNPAKALRLLEMRDIAELYELWCFFTVVGAVQEVLGKPTTASKPKPHALQLRIEWDYAVRWREGVTVYYNPAFHRGSPDRRSYSLPLRPDIALEVSTPAKRELHLFDAKFKVDPGNANGGTFKSADLHKMHAYRDGIPLATSAWLLYPGEKYRFYQSAIRKSESACDGVGAIPHKPGIENRRLMAVLKTIFEDCL